MGKLCLIKDGKICPIPKHIESTGLMIIFFIKVRGFIDQSARKIEGLFFTISRPDYSGWQLRYRTFCRDPKWQVLIRLLLIRLKFIGTNLVPRVFVPLDQRWENESSGSKHFEITTEITEFCSSGFTACSASMAHA